MLTEGSWTQFIFLSFEDEERLLNAAKTASSRHRHLNLCATIPALSSSKSAKLKASAAAKTSNSNAARFPWDPLGRTQASQSLGGSSSAQVNFSEAEGRTKNMLRQVLRFYRNSINVRTMIGRHLPHVKIPIQTGF